MCKITFVISDSIFNAQDKNLCQLSLSSLFLFDLILFIVKNTTLSLNLLVLIVLVSHWLANSSSQALRLWDKLRKGSDKGEAVEEGVSIPFATICSFFHNLI